MLLTSCSDSGTSESPDRGESVPEANGTLKYSLRYSLRYTGRYRYSSGARPGRGAGVGVTAAA